MLDERGVEWRVGGEPRHNKNTLWECEAGRAEFYEDLSNGSTSLVLQHRDGMTRLTITSDMTPAERFVTPEQAIEATLGDADAVEVVRGRDCKHGHITINGKSCKWCDLIATHDIDGNEPNNGYDPEPYFDADFFCAWGERRESE